MFLRYKAEMPLKVEQLHKPWINFDFIFFNEFVNDVIA